MTRVQQPFDFIFCGQKYHKWSNSCVAQVTVAMNPMIKGLLLFKVVFLIESP